MADKDRLIEIITGYRHEAEEAKRSRMDQNRRNYRYYHMEQDWSHKVAGQSTEFLPKQSMAVEQTAAFMHQGLVDFGDWFTVEPKKGVKNPMFTKDEARDILKWQLEKADFYNFMGDVLKSGLLGSLMLAKVGMKRKVTPKFKLEREIAKEEGKADSEILKRVREMSMCLCIEDMRQEDFFPDPTGRGLYFIHRVEMDLHELVKMALEAPEVYDVKAIQDLQQMQRERDDEAKKADETDQDVAQAAPRTRVVIDEMWGTIVDPVDGTILYEDVVVTIANDAHVIRGPEKYPTWDMENCFITSPIIRVPKSVWHRAFMDAPSCLNKAQNELFNLILDSGLMSVHGIKQVRENWLENPSQVTEGIRPGVTLQVNASAPPNAKVLERVDTANNSGEGINAYQLLNAEFNTASLTNDLRQGNLPGKATKATEVVTAEQSINNVFTAIGKNIEKQFVEKLLKKCWNICMQHFKQLNKEEMTAILGEEKMEELKGMSNKQIFVRAVDGMDFKVSGLTQTLNKINDIRKITQMLGTISGSEILMEAFAQKFDFAKLLDEMMLKFDINTDRIKLDESDQELVNQTLQGQGLTADQSKLPQVGAARETGLGPETGTNQGNLPEGF